jgi:predicted DNA-binding transcriptional regulator AlpA
MLATEFPIPDETAEVEQPHRLIGVADVRKMFGDVSDMTLWRWLKDADLKFPKPIYVQRRRFWREAELIEWISNRPTEIDD